MIPQIKQRIEQIRRGEVPEGYKKTKAGTIPFEWDLHPLSKHLIESRIPGTNGAIAKKLTVKLWNKGVFEKREVHEGSESTTYYKRKSGQLIYSKLDFLNCAFGIIPEYLDGYESTQDLPCFDVKGVIPNYLLTYVTQRNFYMHFGMIADGGRKARRVGPEDMLSFPLVYPPLAEQEKIAEILQTQDKVIELKEKLIEEKKRQKKYLMQQLLTGKNRLAGFCGEWNYVKLGSAFEERVETNCQNLELLSVTGTNGVVPRSTIETKDNSSEDKSKYLRICKGDIGYNTMRMWQGVSALSDYDGIVSPAYTILIPSEKVSAKYYSYLFKMHAVIFLFYRFSQGIVDDTRSLKYPEFAKLQLYVPMEKDEQEAIAKILDTTDKEIRLLQKDLEQEIQKKKALMQLLLTGIVRIGV